VKIEQLNLMLFITVRFSLKYYHRLTMRIFVVKISGWQLSLSCWCWSC